MSGKDLAPDWILQQALGVQSAAHDAFVREKGLGGSEDAAPSSQTHRQSQQNKTAKTESPIPVHDSSSDRSRSYTLGVIDCKDTGAAIIHAIIDQLNEIPDDDSSPPQWIPKGFHVSVTNTDHHQKLLGQIPTVKRGQQILKSHGIDHIKVADASDIIILSCSTDSFSKILRPQDRSSDSISMRCALENKVVISAIPNGPSLAELDNMINGRPGDRLKHPATVVRAELNPATVVREGITVIARPEDSLLHLDSGVEELVTRIFEQVGKVMWLSETQMSSAAALIVTGPSFVSVMAEALANGGIGMGLEPKLAHEMAAQVLKGTAGLLQQNATHPAILRDSIITPDGGTSRGLMVLEETGLRSSVTKAVMSAVRGPQ